jgi:F-type H+-transporting ATPase subunit a
MEEISVATKQLFQVSGLAVTNTAFWTLIITMGVLFFLARVFSKAKIIPGKIQNFAEFVLESFLNFCDSITGARQKSLEIFPMAATFFVLIWCCNLMELIPGVGVFPILRSPSSDLNFTLALALISICYINYAAFRKLGLFSYLGRFFNFKGPIEFFVGILEVVSEFSKVISLSMRLFGNLFAGEVLLIVTSSLFAYLMPLPFLALEVLVGLIQALVFATLTVVFYSIATLEHEHG